MKKTKKQLAEEIEALQAEHDSMPDAGTNYKPMMGEGYFIIQAAGGVISYVWKDRLVDIACYVVGNCYPTREVAERIVRNRQTLVKLREFAFVPDFSDPKQEKHHFDMCNGALGWQDKVRCGSRSPVYFETAELRYAADEAVGEAAIIDMLEGGLV